MVTSKVAVEKKCQRTTIILSTFLVLHYQNLSNLQVQFSKEQLVKGQQTNPTSMSPLSIAICTNSGAGFPLKSDPDSAFETCRISFHLQAHPYGLSNWYWKINVITKIISCEAKLSTPILKSAVCPFHLKVDATWSSYKDVLQWFPTGQAAEVNQRLTSEVSASQETHGESLFRLWCLKIRGKDIMAKQKEMILV